MTFPFGRERTQTWTAATTLGITIPLLVWTLVSSTGLINPLFLPTPLAVLHAFQKLFVLHAFTTDILASVLRILLGFGLSILVAVPLGLFLGTHQKAAAFTDPFLNFLRYLPPSALLPLFLLWFGIGESEKILLIFAGVAPYLVLLVSNVAANIPQEFIDVARTLGVSRKTILTRVILPYSLPGIWDAMRVMIGAAWTFVVLAELIAAKSGLGHLIILSQRFLETPNVFAALFTIGFLGFITDLLFQKTHHLLFPWTCMETYARTE